MILTTVYITISSTILKLESKSSHSMRSMWRTILEEISSQAQTYPQQRTGYVNAASAVQLSWPITITYKRQIFIAIVLPTFLRFSAVSNFNCWYTYGQNVRELHKISVHILYHLTTWYFYNSLLLAVLFQLWRTKCQDCPVTHLDFPWNFADLLPHSCIANCSIIMVYTSCTFSCLLVVITQHGKQQMMFQHGTGQYLVVLDKMHI